MSSPSLSWFPPILSVVLDRRDLTDEQVARVFGAALAGELGDAEMAAFLIAMRMKGETAGELAAAAGVLRRMMHRFEANRPGLLDTCGTGGDDWGTFNISTAAAVIAAAAGVAVVKHGNRAVSSRCGSADVLAELGVPVEAGIDWARSCLDRAGIAFCFAPQFHPAMRHLGPLRKRLGVRTMVNLLGPLANPAGATFQLLGVGRRAMLDPVAGALLRLGTQRAFVVCSAEGLDEVSLSATTYYRHICGGEIHAGEWTAADFNLAPCRLDDLRISDAVDSARVIRQVLAGEPGPARRVVLANAAAALVVAGAADDLRSGVILAERAIDSGAASRVLDAMNSTQELPT